MKRIAIPVETTDLCSYGCGLPAKFKNGSGNLMCAERSNSCPAVKAKNSKKLSALYATGQRVSGKEHYSNLPQETKDKMAWNRGKFTGTEFCLNGKGNHKGYLIHERGYRCECCGLDEWLGEPIALELEHIDGNNRNNVKENLKLLCPNCHSQTDTWRGRNMVKKKNQEYVSDEEFLDALNSCKNIRQALIKLGLTPKGLNYDRAYRLMNAPVVK